MPKIIENLPERLAEEARGQIEESGYAAMTIRSVAKGCGVGVGICRNSRGLSPADSRHQDR